MTGWRVGFAAGRAELIGALTRVKSYVDTGPFLAVQKAGAAALEHGEELVAPIRAELQRRRDAAVAALTQAGFKVEPPKAAMYLWVPLPAGTSSASFAKQALEENGVVVLPGSAFGPAGEGFFRIALTVGADRLEAAAVRLGEAFESSVEGRLRPPFDLRLPQRRPWPWIAIVASVVVHSLFLFTSVSGRRPTFLRLPQQLIVLSPPSEGREDVPMRYQPPEAQANRSGRAPAEGERARGDRRRGRCCRLLPQGGCRLAREAA